MVKVLFLDNYEFTIKLPNLGNYIDVDIRRKLMGDE